MSALLTGTRPKRVGRAIAVPRLLPTRYDDIELPPFRPRIASRVVYTPDCYLDGCAVGVHISAIQFADGHFETVSEIPGIYLDCHPDSGLTTSQARSLALMLIESASQLESWIEAFGDATDIPPTDDRSFAAAHQHYRSTPTFSRIISEVEQGRTFVITRPVSPFARGIAAVAQQRCALWIQERALKVRYGPPQVVR